MLSISIPVLEQSQQIIIPWIWNFPPCFNMFSMGRVRLHVKHATALSSLILTTEFKYDGIGWIRLHIKPATTLSSGILTTMFGQVLSSEA